MDKYITKQGLKRRGWTDTLINMFLPVPDKREENPQKSHYPQMCLYSLNHVKSVEWSSAFSESRKNARKRRKKEA
jgi:hypothetical protein